ncbi:helix-turn-helix domain-containing protein [Streptomyces sp. NPDC002519]
MRTATTTAPSPDPSTSASFGLRRIPKGQRLTGEAAVRFAADVINAYETKSIRRICEETGRSYGAIHRLLTTSGVTMRPKGPNGHQRQASGNSADVS